MITFEITGQPNERQLQHMRVVSAKRVEILDEMTTNVTVEDEIADEFSDWIDAQEEPYLTSRVV